jgi:hypothetical protein
MPETRELMVDGQMKQFTRQPDRNGEYLYVAEDGRFVKFPKDVNIEEAIARHNEVNSKPVELVEDVTYGRVEHRTATQPVEKK